VSIGVQGNTRGRNTGGDKAGAVRVDAGRAGVQERDRAAVPCSPQEPGEPDRLLLPARRADAGLRVRRRWDSEREPCW
jgi:hypothetical protein